MLTGVPIPTICRLLDTYLIIIWCFFKAFRACFIQIIPFIFRFEGNRVSYGYQVMFSFFSYYSLLR
jgi:hypothetical protein